MSAMRLLLPVGAALLGLYWLTDRAHPVEQISNVALAPVHAGEPVEIETRVLRRRACTTHLDRFFFDASGHRFELPDVDFTPDPADVGHPIFYRQWVETSRLATPGIARIELLVAWRCNPLHHFWPIRDVVGIPFRILPTSNLTGASPCGAPLPLDSKEPSR